MIGTVENVNVDPPFDDTGVIEAELVEETEKSEAKPVEAPLASETLTVQDIATPVRWGTVDTHTRLEAVVGIPRTTNDGEPEYISDPLTRA